MQDRHIIEKYDFGLRLQGLRKQKNLSQEALAKKIGITKSTVLRYENNTVVPPLDKATQIAILLDTSLNEIEKSFVFLTARKKEALRQIRSLHHYSRKSNSAGLIRTHQMLAFLIGFPISL